MTGQMWRAVMKYSQIVLDTSEVNIAAMTTRINDDLMSLYGYGTDTKKQPVKEQWSRTGWISIYFKNLLFYFLSFF
jgi:hypothetical protein